VGWHRLARKQAVVLKQGAVHLQVRADDGLYEQTLQGTATAWDAYALPEGHWRSLHNPGTQDALMLLLTSGDEKKAIEWDPAIVDAAAAQGWTLDANGCTAPKYFVDRSQR
jgi:hypothetical protein